MKKLFFIVALSAASFTGFAQKDAPAAKPLSFSVGLEAAFPIGDFADGYSFGIGGSVQADYMVAPKFAVTLNAGYISYSGKTISGSIGGVNYSTNTSNTGINSCIGRC